MNPGSGTSKSEKGQKETTLKRINERQRMNYIGFDVFPGEPKDLFASEAEREKLVEQVRQRHQKHDHLREDCTLLEARINNADRIALTLASIVIVLTLFLPWYSAYNEIVEEIKPTQVVEKPAAIADTMADTTVQSAAATAVPNPPGTTASVTEESPIAPAEHTEELITAFSAKKKIHKEYARLSGVGALISIGTLSSYVFSSGLSLMLTAIMFLVYTLLCIALPIYNLYGIYGLKGDHDAKALKIKKMLSYNWIPLAIFTAGLLLSFVSGPYGFDAATVFTSIGQSYSPMAYLGTLSWGVFISLACFILCAAKGVEI